MSSDEVVASLAERQHGLINRRQARGAGMSDRQIAHRLSSGRWRLVRRGVFAVCGTPRSRAQSIHAACLVREGVIART